MGKQFVKQKENRKFCNISKKNVHKTSKELKLVDEHLVCQDGKGIKNIERLLESEIEVIFKKKKIDMHLKQQLEFYSLLAKAVYVGNERAVDELLDLGEDINNQTAEGNTPLMIAIDKGEISIAQKLLQRGANIKLTRKNGMNALMIAVSKKDYRVFLLLWDYVDKNDTCFLNQVDTNGYTILTLSLERSFTECVSIFSKLNGMIVDKQTNDGISALMMAAKKGQLSTVKNLLQAGSNITLEDKHGATALCLALVHGQAEVSATFLSVLSIEQQDTYIKKRIELLGRPKPKNLIEMVKFYKNTLFHVMLEIRKFFRNGLKLLQKYQFFFGLMKCAQSHQFDYDLLRSAFHLSACVMCDINPQNTNVAMDIAKQYVEAKGPDFSLRIMLSHRSKEHSDIRGAAFLPIHACSQCDLGRSWLVENLTEVQRFLDDFRSIAPSIKYWKRDQNVQAMAVFLRFEEIMREISLGSLSLKRISSLSQLPDGQCHPKNCQTIADKLMKKTISRSSFEIQETPTKRTNAYFGLSETKVPVVHKKVRNLKFYTKLVDNGKAKNAQENNVPFTFCKPVISSKQMLPSFHTGYADALKKNMKKELKEKSKSPGKNTLPVSLEDSNIQVKRNSDMIKGTTISKEDVCDSFIQGAKSDCPNKNSIDCQLNSSTSLTDVATSSKQNISHKDVEFDDFNQNLKKSPEKANFKTFCNRWLEISLACNPIETLTMLSKSHYKNVLGNKNNYQSTSHRNKEHLAEFELESEQIFEASSQMNKLENHTSTLCMALTAENKAILSSFQETGNINTKFEVSSGKCQAEEEVLTIEKTTDPETSVKSQAVGKRSRKRSVLELLKRASLNSDKNTNSGKRVNNSKVKEYTNQLNENSKNSSNASYCDITKKNIKVNESNLNCSEKPSGDVASNLQHSIETVSDVYQVFEQKDAAHDSLVFNKNHCGVSNKELIQAKNNVTVRNKGKHNFVNFIQRKLYSKKVNDHSNTKNFENGTKLGLILNISEDKGNSGILSTSEGKKSDVLCESKKEILNTYELVQSTSASNELAEKKDEIYCSDGKVGLYSPIQEILPTSIKEEKSEKDVFSNEISREKSPILYNDHLKVNDGYWFIPKNIHDQKLKYKAVEAAKQRLLDIGNTNSLCVISKLKLQSWPKYIALYQRLVCIGIFFNSSHLVLEFLNKNQSQEHNSLQKHNSDWKIQPSSVSTSLENTKSSMRRKIMHNSKMLVQFENQMLYNTLREYAKLIAARCLKLDRKFYFQVKRNFALNELTASREQHRKSAREITKSKIRKMHTETNLKCNQKSKNFTYQENYQFCGYTPVFINIEIGSKWYKVLKNILSCVPLSQHLLTLGMVESMERKTLHSIHIPIGQVIFSSKPEHTLREGAFGSYIGLLHEKGDPVIVREFKYVNRFKEETINSLTKKCLLEHRNIAKLYGVSINPLITKSTFVRELCEFTLPQYLKISSEMKRFKWESKFMVADLLEGVQYLHEMKIIHGFLKPMNILVTIDYKLKIADCFLLDVSPLVWGTQYLLSDKRAIGPVSLSSCSWRPNELITATNETDARKNMSYASDVQMVGMLIYFILSKGKHPFGCTDTECQENINQESPMLGTEPANVEARDLIQEMLKGEPSKRPSISLAMKHPYFWDIESRFQFLLRVCRKISFYENKVTGELEEYRRSCIESRDWTFHIPSSLMEYLCEFKNTTYTNEFLDFLKFILALHENFLFMPISLKRFISKPSLFIFQNFPSFFMSVYDVIRSNSLSQRQMGFQHLF